MFTITVIANTAPTDLTLSKASFVDGSGIPWTNKVLADFVTTDPDKDQGDGFTYELVAGDGDTDNAMFTIIPGTTWLTAKDAFVLAEGTEQQTFSVRVKVTDLDGNAFEKVLSVTFEKNLPPTDILVSNATISAADAVSGAVIGQLTAVDGNNSSAAEHHEFLIIGGDDGALFSIDGDTLRAAVALGSAMDMTYTVNVRVWDAGGFTFDKQLKILVAAS